MSEFTNVSNEGNIMGDNNINCNQNIYNGNVYDNKIINNYVSNNNFSVFVEECVKQFKNSLSSKNDYHYSSNIIPLIGRDNEINELNEFLKLDDRLSIVAITADGGSGKSKLAYEFVKQSSKNENKKDWDMFFVDCRVFFDDFGKIEIFDEPKKNIVLVFDYILAYADEIRNFLYIMSKKQVNIGKKVRVILIERSTKEKNKNEMLFSQEYDWYYKIIKNRKEGESSLKEYFYKEITLNKLKEEDYVKIAKKYIKKKYPKEAKSYNTKKILKSIIKPFKMVDLNLERVLYLMFSVDMVVGEKKDIYNKTDLLNNIIEREERRVCTILGKNSDKLLPSVKGILAYASAVGILDLKKLMKNSEHFLYNDWKKMCDNYKNDYVRVVNIFKTIFNNANETKADITLVKAIKPDLLGELFCVELLDNERNNPNNIFSDIDYVDEFMQTAWKEDEKGFYEFLIRVIEDYSEEKDIKYLIVEPKEDNIKLKEKYAGLLCRLTCYYKSKENCKKIVEKLKLLYENNKENEEIALMYAGTMLNLTYVQENEKEIREIIEVLKEIYKKNEKNEEIALIYAGSLLNLTCMQYVEEDCKETIKQLKEVYKKNIKNEEMAQRYVGGLVNLTCVQYTEEKIKETVEKLEEVYNKFRENEEIALNYVGTMLNLTCIQKTKENRNKTIEKIEKVAKKYPLSEEIMLIFSSLLLYNFCDKNSLNENIDVKIIIDKISDLCIHFDNYNNIFDIYCSILKKGWFDNDGIEKINQTMKMISKP